MRENLDQWDFVIACYIITVLAVAAMVGWCWIAMTKAEKRREEAKRK